MFTPNIINNVDDITVKRSIALVLMIMSLVYHHHNINRPSVTGGQRKQFDLKKQGTVSLAVEGKKLEIGDLCERQSSH